MPASAIAMSRFSQDLRSSADTLSGSRQNGGSGHPTILCSGTTRPSSKRKSRQTSPHRTSLRIPSFTPSFVTNDIFCPFSGGQSTPPLTPADILFIPHPWPQAARSAEASQDQVNSFRLHHVKIASLGTVATCGLLLRNMFPLVVMSTRTSKRHSMVDRTSRGAGTPSRDTQQVPSLEIILLGLLS